jgi:glycosyltransferase involved in cell wall biosynthesis
MDSNNERTPPSISVIIPVKNESQKIAACLDGILKQTIPAEEIIVIDSGSTDGTQEIATAFPKVRLVEIKSEKFNHGGTRNLGVNNAKGDYLLFTVGDARPVTDKWIQELLDGFVDETVAGVCGSQVVAQDKETNPVEWFRPQSQPTIATHRFANSDEFEAASPEEKLAACSWDDVSAMYKRDVMQTIPFRETIYGEDVFWAMDALKEGHTLAYNPAARVYHFHLDNYETTLKRTIAVSYLRYNALGVIPTCINAPKAILRSLYRLFKEEQLSWDERWYWLRYNVNLVRALHSGLKQFRKALKNGTVGLDKLHEKYCGTPPIPLKNP